MKVFFQTATPQYNPSEAPHPVHQMFAITLLSTASVVFGLAAQKAYGMLNRKHVFFYKPSDGEPKYPKSTLRVIMVVGGALSLSIGLLVTYPLYRDFTLAH